MKRLLVLLILSSNLWAAAVTHLQVFTNTAANNAGPYTTAAFTPTANDLIGVFVVASGEVDAGTMTDTQSLGWTKIASAVKNASADTVYFWVANTLAANSSMTISASFGSDSATAVIIEVFGVSGMTRTGTSSAVRGFATQANGGGGGTPNVGTMAQVALTGNPCVGLIGNGSNPATMTAPASWTEQSDTGIGTPNTGAEYISRDSGFTSNSLTWGGTSATGFAGIIAEFDTSAASTFKPRLTLMGVG